MPVECALLDDLPSPFDHCPACGCWPFLPFMRGQVQRSSMWWLFPWRKRPYSAVICAECKAIVGYESPDGEYASA